MKCPACGCEVSKRSSQQNRLYWSWLNIISDHTGYSSKALHEHFKELFLTPEIQEVFDEVVKVYKSTTDLSTKEFNLYLEFVQMYASENIEGINLPIPEDLKFKGIENLIH